MTGILGYARISISDQDVAGQSMRLTEAGAIKIFTDVRSGRTMDRPGLVELLAYSRNGDTLAVVRLDHLGRSLAELLATVSMLKERGIALLSLEEKIDTSSAAGELVFRIPRVWRNRSFRAQAYRRANQGRNYCRSRPRQAIQAQTARRRSDRRSTEAGSRRIVAHRRSAPDRPRTFNRLS